MKTFWHKLIRTDLFAYFMDGLIAFSKILAIFVLCVAILVSPILLWGFTKNSNWLWLFSIHFVSFITFIGWLENNYE